MRRGPLARTRLAALVGVGLVAGGGCFLDDLDLANRPCPCTDGYVCVNDVCVLGGESTSSSTASGTGGMTTSSSGASMTTVTSSTMSDVASSSTSTGGPTLPLAKPLVYESPPDSGTLSLSTEGAFRIQTIEAVNWQWSRYFDLGNGDPDDLSSSLPGVQYQQTDLLLEPAWLTTNESDWASSQSASLVDVTVTDETPLRVLVETTLAYPFTGAEVYTATYTYPSGRMTTYVELYNTSQTDLNFAQIEYNYVAVNPNLAGGDAAWSETSWMDLGVAFVHDGGPSPKSTVFFVNVFGDKNLHQDSPHTSWYWGDFGSITVPVGGDIYADGELQLGPAGQPAGKLVARTDDALNPELEIMSGGSAVDGGYNTYLGTYVLAADLTATKMEFAASNAYERHAPAFEIYGFKPPNWRVMFRGQEVCSSLEHVGHGCVAWEETDHIAFELMVDIPAFAPLEDRLVTLEAAP